MGLGGSFMNRKGFTLIELLVVIAIIAILAAILFPVFARAKQAGMQASCLSNVRQLSSAMMVYLQNSNDVFPQGIVGTDYHNFHTFKPQRTAGMPGSTYEVSDGTHFGFWKSWMDLLYPYYKTTKVLVCPAIGKRTFFASQGMPEACYAYNPSISGLSCLTWGGRDYPANMAMIRHQTKLVMLFDCGTAMATIYDGFWAAQAFQDESLFFIHPHNGGANFAFADGHAKWIDRKSDVVNSGTSNTNKRNPYWWVEDN